MNNNRLTAIYKRYGFGEKFIYLIIDSEIMRFY